MGITIDIFSGSRPDLHPFLIEMTPYPPNGDGAKPIYFRYATIWQVLSSNTVVRAQKRPTDPDVIWRRPFRSRI